MGRCYAGEAMSDLDIRGPQRDYATRKRMADISKEVASAYGMTADALRGPMRTAYFAKARHEAFYLCQQQGFSLEQIGRFFGGRDHTTVMSGISREKALREAENAQ